MKGSHSTVWERIPTTAVERRGNTIKECEDFRTQNGSRQGQNLALTVLVVPSSLESGPQSTLGLLGGTGRLRVSRLEGF